MAESSIPTPDDGRLVTDGQYEQLLSGYVPSGILGSPGDTTVAYGTGVGMYVTLRASKHAWVRGHKWYSGSSTSNIAIAANSSGNPRIDLVVLRLTRSTWNVACAVVQGTPAVSPTVPALTQGLGTTGTFEVPIAEVAVANGATVITAANVTSRDYYLDRVSMLGTLANRPLSGTYIGQRYTATDSPATVWSGSAWAPPPQLFSRLTADATGIVTNVTLADVAGLAVPVVADAEYQYDVQVIYTAAGGNMAGQLQLGWTAPAGASLMGSVCGLVVHGPSGVYGQITTDGCLLSSSRSFGAGGSLWCTAWLKGILTVSTTPGNFQLQAAQVVSSATPTIIKAGTIVKLERLE